MKSGKFLCAAGAGLIFLFTLTACNQGQQGQPAPAVHQAEPAPAPVAPAATRHSGTIQLSVVPEGTSHKLNKSGRLVCNASRPEGCIKVPHGDSASVTFSLNAKPDWHLTKITICPQTGPCELTLPQRADFEFTMDGTGTPLYVGENGELDLTALDPGLQAFVMDDRNTVAQNYDYTIVACKDEDCTTADPPLENRGMN